MKKVKLFCIPYAGGMASAYYKWKDDLADYIELCPLEPAGHGRRIKDPFYETVYTAADDMSDIISGLIADGEDYAMYGHSLGSLCAFETYYALKKKGVREPVHIFFSGRNAPDDKDDPTGYYKLPDREFLEKVYFYGGNTEAMMENKELRDFFIPILRSDFKLAETYEYRPRDEKILCNMTIVNGAEDLSVLKADLDHWQKFAGKACHFNKIGGTHFFILDHVKEVTAIINHDVMQSMEEVQN